MGVAFSSPFCNAGNASMPADLRRLDALIDLLVDALLHDLECEAAEAQFCDERSASPSKIERDGQRTITTAAANCSVKGSGAGT
jgi:hypothetical protein